MLSADPALDASGNFTGSILGIDGEDSLIGRGVRRVFCIVVGGAGKGRRKSRRRSRLLEWAPRLDGWAPVPEDGAIEDRCLDPPMPVR